MLTLQSKLIGAAILLVSLWIAYEWIGARAVAEYKQEIAVKQAEANKLQQAKYDKLTEDYEALKIKRQENARVIEKRVETVVTRDVYRNVCLDDDGLSIINSAIRGSGSPQTEMPSDPAR